MSDSVGPLFAGIERAGIAADNAERLESGWRGAALDAVRRHALTHERFLAQDVAIQVPAGATLRAKGSLMPEAARRGWIEPAGYARDAYGSAKTTWRSLIFGCAS